MLSNTNPVVQWVYPPRRPPLTGLKKELPRDMAHATKVMLLYFVHRGAKVKAYNKNNIWGP